MASASSSTATREVRPPFSPEAVIDDFAILLKTYRISKVTGDRYAGEFPRELFRKRGIEYRCCGEAKERSVSRSIAAAQRGPHRAAEV